MSATLVTTGVLLSLSITFAIMATIIPLNTLQAIFAGENVGSTSNVDLFVGPMRIIWLVMAAVSLVTEWDYLAKIVAESRDPGRVKLGEIMTGELVAVDANEGLDQVAQVMAQKGIRRVLVIKDHKVLGVITAKTMLSRLKEYVDRVSSQIARLQSPMF